MSPTDTAPVTVILMRSAGVALQGNTTMQLSVNNDHDVSQHVSGTSPLTLNLPFHNGLGDAYRMVVSVPGYHNSGNFVHAQQGVHQTVEMLMIPQHAELEFPSWADLQTQSAAAARVIVAGTDDKTAQAHYADISQSHPLALASLLNLSAAMQEIPLSPALTPLDFIREVIWDNTLAQDRFFAWADPALLPLVRAAAAHGEFAEERDPGRFHPGATSSYKQVQFSYSNVQLTFHEHDTATINGQPCLKLEPDMDLFKGLLSHGIAEVIPNLSTGSLTNPLDVLALRWIDAVQSNEPLFNPGYTFA